jgi:hypothetical protein
LILDIRASPFVLYAIRSCAENSAAAAMAAVRAIWMLDTDTH